MPERILEILLKAEDKASGIVDKTAKKTGASMDKVRMAVGTAMTAAGAAITGFMVLSLKAASDSEVAWVRVRTSLGSLDPQFIKSVGGMGSLESEVTKVSLKFQDLAGFSDELEGESFARLLGKTQNLTEAQKLLGLANDFARYKGMDLGEATNVVMQIFAGNTRVMKQFGIEVDKNATPQDVLRVLMEKTAGAAEKYGGTIAGQTDILRQKWDNIMEQVGGQLMPILTELLQKHIIPLIDKIMAWVKENPKLFATIVKIVAGVGILMTVLGPLLLMLPTLSAAFGILTTTALGPVVLAIAAIIAIGVLLWRNWDTIKSKAAELWNNLKGGFQYLVDSIKGFFNNLIAFFTGIPGRIWNALKNVGTMILNAFKKIHIPLPHFKFWLEPKKVGPVTIDWPKWAIDWYQKGGIFKEPSIIGVGERGPEAVVPLNKGLVGAGIGNINIYIEGGYFFGTIRDAAEQLTEEIGRILNKQYKR